jgi:hypothetical protein
MKRLVSGWLMLCCCWGVGGGGGDASGRAAGRAARTSSGVALDQLEPGEGVVWGDWIIWRNREKEPRKVALFLQHRASQSIIYVWSGSNGWINYRDNAGEWYLKLSQGTPEKQDRKDLKVNDYLTAKPSDRRLGFGTRTLGNWKVTITAEQMELTNDLSNDRLLLKADSGVFTHNGRRLGQNPPRGQTKPEPMPREPQPPQPPESPR